MRPAHFTHIGGLAAVVLLASGLCGVQGQPADTGPVDRLADVLRQIQPSPAVRARQLQERVGELRSCADLYHAWALPGWYEPRPGDAVAAVDQQCRRRIGERFLREAKTNLSARDPSVAANMADWLAEAAVACRTAGERPVLLRGLGADLAALVRRNQPESQAAAIRALGLVEPDPAVALPIFHGLLRSPDLDLRRAGAAGLMGLLSAALQSLGWARGDAVKEARSELAAMAAAVVPVARLGLDDAVVEVRRNCAGTLRQASAALSRMTAGPVPTDLVSEDHRTGREAAIAQMQPLVERLRDLGPGLACAIRDDDVEVRLLACQAVEGLAEARWQWLRLAGRTPSTEPRDDPLRLPLRSVLPGLSGAAGDDEVSVRRAALDALERIGPDATPAVPALARALRDPDRSVRRTAIRVLGGLGPVVARAVVGELSALLDDPDPDLALAAVLALQQIVPHAAAEPGMLSVQETALPALVKSLQSRDASMRVAVLQTLRGFDASPAVPAVCEILADPDAKVRKAAAETLGGLGPAAGAAVDPLRHALADASPEVREAARAALLAIRRPTQR
jgi:HEAT repeat protein